MPGHSHLVPGGQVGVGLFDRHFELGSLRLHFGADIERGGAGKLLQLRQSLLELLDGALEGHGGRALSLAALVV